jgi:phage FluMu protein Com
MVYLKIALSVMALVLVGIAVCGGLLVNMLLKSKSKEDIEMQAPRRKDINESKRPEQAAV